MIKLKEGQRVLGEDGNVYEIEKGDLIESISLTEQSFEDLVEEVAELTDVNNHIEALVLIAKFLKNKRFIKISEGIQIIQDAENSLPEEISKYRSNIYKQLFDFAKKQLSAEQYKMLYQAT